MSQTVLGVLAITVLSLGCCAFMLLVFWAAPDPRRKHASQKPAEGPPAPGISHPAARPTVDTRAQRHTAAITFIGFLIGLAYQEAVSPVSSALKEGHFTWVTAGLVTTFFFFGLSTFFGGFYHFLVAPWTGLGWVCNFLVVVLSAVILVFMAGVCTEQASTGTSWGMFRWALAYSLLMAVWALAIVGWLAWSRRLQAASTSTRASLADTLVATTLVVVIYFAFSDQYATVPALLLAAVAVLRFVRDLQILIHEQMV